MGRFNDMSNETSKPKGRFSRLAEAGNSGGRFSRLAETTQQKQIKPNDPRSHLRPDQIKEAEGNKNFANGLDDKYKNITKHIPDALIPNALKIKPSSYVAGAKGFTHNMDEYGATINKGLGKVAGAFGFDGVKKSFDKDADWWNDQRRMNEIETEGHDVAKMAGELIADPINLMGGGLVTKGGKIARIGKSMATGAGVGIATSKAKNYGNDDLTDKQKADEDVMSAGFTSVLNGIIAGVTKGRVTNAVKDIDMPPKIDEATGKVVERTGEENAQAVIDNHEAFGLSMPEAEQVAKEVIKADTNLLPTEIPPSKVPPQEDNIFNHPRAKEAIDMARDRYASQTYNDRVGGGSSSWMDENNVYHRYSAKGEKNYQQGFELSKSDIKKIDNGKITPEIEEKLRLDIDRLENDPHWNSETPQIQDTHIDDNGDLIDSTTGQALFSNAGHHLAGGFGAGTVNAGSGVFDGSYDPNKDLSEQMADRFIQGMVAGTMGVTGLKLLRKTNPQAFKKVQSWVMDNNIKAGDKLPTKGVRLGVFAGKKAKGFDGATSTHAGKYDGQTRFEIDDSNMRAIPKGLTDLFSKGESKLGNVIEHKELFDNYPELKNVDVKFDKDMQGHASFDGENTIVLSNKFSNKDDIESSIIHEIQHAIQNKEGFAGGGNFDDAMLQVEGKISDLEKKGDLSQLDAMNYMDKLDNLKNNKTDEAFKRYQNIAGEIEAREVQARKNLTPEERELIPAYENSETMATGKHSDEAYNSAFMAQLEGRHGDFDSAGIAPKDATLDFSRSRVEMSPVKSKSQKEKRGIYNVTFNGKESAVIRKNDLDEFISYTKGDRKHGAKHIEIRHLGDDKTGNVSKEELLDIGKVIRDGKMTENNGKIVYTLFDDENVRFKAVIGKGKKGDKIISFYSNKKAGRHNASSTLSDVSIAQNQKKSNMRDGFIKISESPKNSKSFFSHNFDDLEKNAKSEMDKDWKDLSQSNGTLKNLWNGLNYFMRDSMSGKYHEIRDITHANLQKSDGELANLGRVLDELDETTDTNLFSYLVKESDGKDLPDGVKKMGDMIRYTVDKKSRNLVDKGLLDKESVDEWIGAYLYRMYEPTMAKKVGNGVGGNFKKDKNFERGDPKDFSKDDIKGITGWLNKNGFLDDADLQKLHTIDDIQKHLNGTDSIGMLREGKLKLADLGDSIRLKRDWTRAERDAMGEVRSAKITVLETLARMNKLEQHAEFLERASKTEGVIADKMLIKNLSNIELNKKGFYKLDKSAQLGAMSGKWVRRDVADDIDRTTKDVMHIHDDWFNVWNAGHGLWKKSKTVWNPTAHANNFAGNVFLMHLAGVNGTKIGTVLNNGRKGMVALKKLEDLEYKGLKGNLTQSEATELKELKGIAKYAIEAKQNGIFGRSQLNDILAGLEQNTTGGGILKKADRFLSKAYQAEDNFNRLSFYLTLRESGKDAKTAKKMVDFMLPDYTKPLPKGFRVLRDSSIAPFISWTYYTMPSIVKMMGTKRGGMKVATVLGLISTMEYITSGGEITPLDNIPSFLGGTNSKPEDFKGRRFVYGKDGDNYKTIKLDRMIPYAELQSLPNYMNGLLSGILPNLAYTTRGKQLYSGRNITSDKKSGGDQAIDWVKHIISQYTPIPVPVMNAVNSVDNATRSQKRRMRNRVMQPRTSTQEILKNIGLNTMEYSRTGLRKEQRR